MEQIQCAGRRQGGESWGGMMGEGKTRSGGCLCRAVRFTAAPHNAEVGICHCGMCRKWTAGPFAAKECGDSVRIEDESNLVFYRSSEWAERGFCRRCGTSLFYRLVGRRFVAVSAEAFDDTTDFVLTSQIFIDEKPSCYSFANQTKNMTGAEVFAAFAAPDGAKGH
jgi:hypothetical protein